MDSTLPWGFFFNMLKQQRIWEFERKKKRSEWLVSNKMRMMMMTVVDLFEVEKGKTEPHVVLSEQSLRSVENIEKLRDAHYGGH